MAKYKTIFQNENPDCNEDDSQSDFNEVYIEWLEAKLANSQLALNNLLDVVMQYCEGGNSETLYYFQDEMKQAKQALL